MADTPPSGMDQEPEEQAPGGVGGHRTVCICQNPSLQWKKVTSTGVNCASITLTKGNKEKGL